MAVPDPDSLNERQLKAAAKLLAAVSPLVTELGALFAAAGHELALVGGPVRDVFLGRLSQDLDLTTDAPPERILEITGDWADQTWKIGIDFGTVGLRKGSQTFEITTYRADSYDRTSRKPVVTYGESLEADLARRDFTVNAMAAQLPGYRLVDPFGGLQDLRRGLLRTPGAPEESFSDDPLRILRAARFTAQLGLTAAPEVRAAMTELAGLLAPPRVSAERIEGELTKLLLSPRPGGPAAGIALLVETGVADQILPEVPALRLESDEHFRHKDVYQHSLTVLRQAIDLEPRYGLEPDIVLRLAALLHDIGKPRTRSRLPGGRVGFHHHEVVGAKMARKRLSSPAVPQGDRRGRQPPGRAAPAVPRLRRGRVDRLGRTAVRDRRRTAADAAARPHQGRLHDQEQGKGAAAGAGLRRPGGPDSRACRAGGAGQHPAGPGRQRDHGDPGHPARTAGRPGLQAPEGAAASTRARWATTRRFRNCCAGPSPRGWTYRLHQAAAPE